MNNKLLLPLTNLLSQADDNVLLLDSGGGRCIAQLKAEIVTKMDYLQRTNVSNCLLYRSSTCDFVSDLLACIYAGVDITLLPNDKRNTVKQAQHITDGVLADISDNGTNNIYELDKKLTSTQSPQFLLTIDNICVAHDITISLFTSGSTGKPKVISRPLSYLLAEAQMLEQLWGTMVGGAVFLSTVSHQHIYGLLFKVLWPLCYGHKIWSATVPFEENLYHLIARHKHSVLISSPAFLTRLNGGLTAKKSLQCVFSSGGVLTQSQAVKTEELLHTRCIRVFGSTETGGIAYQDSTTDIWTTLPHVVIKQQQEVLHISSPYCYQQPWYITSDRIALVDSDNENTAEYQRQFKLLGRTDDIVKIEEKRISLSEVENALCQHSAIKHAKVLVLPKQRKCLGAVLILHDDYNIPSPHTHLFYQQLRTFLSDYFEAVTLPKYFRCVKEFPENEQGKLDHCDMIELFNNPHISG